jgi:hypothetical protein
MPEYVADDSKTYTEYGIQFPNGDRQWTGHGPFEFHMAYLGQPEGRKEAQALYDRLVAELNLVPAPDTKLTFVKRRVASAYTAVEVIEDGEGNV